MKGKSNLPWLKVSSNGRFLVTDRDEPFFWLGDTAWELFQRMNREEVDEYMATRSTQGYNVIQVTALAEWAGLTKGNAYGRVPLKQRADGTYDPAQPDAERREDEGSYWDHVDYVVERAAQHGLYIAFVLTWGDKYFKAWGDGPEIFNPDNAYAYGRWIGERYKDCSNLIWVVGGDRMLQQRIHFEIVHRMAMGLKEGDDGRHLITFHPQGGFSSSFHVHAEDWLDFNMIQSGHANTERDNYKHVLKDYALQPIKPTIDAEPCYEDHPRGEPENGYFDDAEVRKAAYYAVLSGAFGHSYGHHCVWSVFNGEIGDTYGTPFWRERAETGDYFLLHWRSALERPGAVQMKHVRSLIESRPMLELRPDDGLVVSNFKGSNYMPAARGVNYAYIYSPNGVRFEVQLGILGGESVKVSWYDPRHGTQQVEREFVNEGSAVVQPPTCGRGQDWVLILEAAGE